MTSNRDGAYRSVSKADPASSWRVVLIVASGDLKAIEDFFSAALPLPGAAFILLLQTSGATSIISKLTDLGRASVVEARHGIRLRQDHVYVVPPDKHLRIERGALVLGELETQCPEARLDTALRTLAADQRERVVVVILSGRESGGVHGLREIKAHGGVVIVQDPRTANDKPMQMPMQCETIESEFRRVNAWLEQQVRQRTAALRESEERFREVLDSAVDAIVTVDPHGTIKSFNDSACRMFGYTTGEAIGKNMRILMSSPHLRLHRRARTAKMIGEAREMAARRKDGSCFPVQLSIRPIDRLNLFAASIRDLSERKALHEEILRIAELAQHRIGEELHDTVQQDLTGLSLLAANLADSLEHRGEPGECYAVVRKLCRGIDTIQERVHALAHGLVPLDIAEDGLVSALRELAERMTAVYGVACRFEGPSRVTVDTSFVATHLYRIGQEAAVNSIKHGKPKTVLIRLSRCAGQLELRVEDDGIGFRRQAVQERSSRLGLRIIKYRSALIGGTLRVEERENGGTLVACRLHAAGHRRTRQNGNQQHVGTGRLPNR